MWEPCSQGTLTPQGLGGAWRGAERSGTQHKQPRMRPSRFLSECAVSCVLSLRGAAALLVDLGLGIRFWETNQQHYIRFCYSDVFFLDPVPSPPRGAEWTGSDCHQKEQRGQRRGPAGGSSLWFLVLFPNSSSSNR